MGQFFLLNLHLFHRSFQPDCGANTLWQNFDFSIVTIVHLNISLQKFSHSDIFMGYSFQY